MKKIILIILISCSLNAQTIINAPEINAIVYDSSGNYDFYHKTKDGFYQTVYLDFDTTNNIITYEKELNTNKRSKKKVLSSNKVLVDIDEIKKVNVNQFVGNQSFIFENKNYKYDSPTLFLLQNFSKQLIAFSEITYIKNELKGFGSHVENSDNDIEKWRVLKSQFYHKVIINIANNKQIIALTDGSGHDEIFIPLTNNTINIIDSKTFKENINAKNNKYSADIKGLLRNFPFEEFYQIKLEDSSKKHMLISNFNQKLISKKFDTIYLNNYYIIGKQKDNYNIFNSNLKPLKTETVKAAYLYKNGLDILTKKGAQYYNYKGEKIDKFPSVSYSVCGTVSSTTYEITKKDKGKFPHQINVREGYFSEDDFCEIYFLEGLKHNQNVSFLNNSIEFTWDGNDSFMESIYIQPNLLLVTENNKVGIVSYNSKKAKKIKEKEKTPEYYITKKGDTIIKAIPPLELNIKKLAKTTTILPIEFDDIKLNNKDGLIYIYKNNKIGIYPYHKQAIYDSITPITNHFYKIVKNGKTGWLDTQTFNEYF